MKRFMLIAMLCCVGAAHGFTLSSENLSEIDMRWRALFDEQLAHGAAKMSGAVERYKEHLLAITDADSQYAGQLIVSLCRGAAWDAFVEHKDKDSVLAYIALLTAALQQYVDQSCTLTFPPKLDAIADGIQRSDLTEVEFCSKVRRAFLAFTIIVSKMNYIAQQ